MNQLNLKPTGRLGPWHDFTPDELGAFDDPWEPWCPARPFDPDALHAEGTPRDDGMLDVSESWGRLYRLEWPGREEACLWIERALESGSSYSVGHVTPSFFHRETAIDPATDLADFARRLSVRWFSQTSRLARLLRPFAPFPDVVRAILIGVRGHTALHWLGALGAPPEEHRDEVVALITEHIASLHDPFDDMNVRMLYEGLASSYPTPYLVKLAFEVAAQNSYFWDTERLWTRLSDPADVLRCSDMMKGGKQLSPEPEDVRFWVARFGLDDLDGLFERVLRRNTGDYAEELYAEAFRVRDPGWVALLRPLATRRKSADIVESYLRNEGINAIEGLLQVAEGRGKARLWALDWLATLAADAQKRAWIDERLAEHPSIADAVREHLGVEQAREVVAPEWTQGAVPDWSWLDVERLERAHLVDGGVLEPASLAATLTNGHDLNGRVANLSDVLQSVVGQWWFVEEGAEEMAAFVRRHAGHADATRWVDAVQSRQAWKRGKRGYPQRKRAMALIASLDLPAARRGLLQFTDFYSEKLRRYACELLDEVLEQQDCTRDEFADRAVPTFGLDALGERTFDYGGRTIRLVVAGRNDVKFIDSEVDREYSRLPRARKSDDAREVRNHQETWKLIREPLLSVFGEEADRMEAAMVHQRAWSPTAFQALMAHPLLGHLARRLIWHTGGTAFMMTAEGDACDVNLDTIKLGGDEIYLAHPAQIDATEWAAVVADLEVIQPFDQLNREAPEKDPLDADLESGNLIEAATGLWKFIIRDDGLADLVLVVSGESLKLRLEPGLSMTKHGRVSRYQEPMQWIGAVEGEPSAVHLAELRHLMFRSRP